MAVCIISLFLLQEVFMAACNKLECIPEGLCRYIIRDKELVSVFKFYLVIDMFHTHYQTVDGISYVSFNRCIKLRKLVLHTNCLFTLPEGIHFLTSLEVQCELHNIEIIAFQYLLSIKRFKRKYKLFELNLN